MGEIVGAHRAGPRTTLVTYSKRCLAEEVDVDWRASTCATPIVGRTFVRVVDGVG